MAYIQGDNLKQLTGKERLGQNRMSEYLGAEDIDPTIEPILTIAGLWNGMVTLQRGKENKDVLTFSEKSVSGIFTVRPLIINATNRKILRKLYGSVTAETLVGKQIQLYIDHNVRDPQDGGKTDGVRIRQKRPTPPKDTVYLCRDCNKPITGFDKYTAHQIAGITQKKYGVTLCHGCSIGRKTASQEGTVNETDGK